jgi:hypothetical protein
MKHNYIKNFKHLINLINSVINDLDEEQINKLNYYGVGDAQFYYNNVYQYEYCDAFAYAITKQDIMYLTIASVKEQKELYEERSVAYGRNYNKNWLTIPDELKDK